MSKKPNNWSCDREPGKNLFSSLTCLVDSDLTFARQVMDIAEKHGLDETAFIVILDETLPYEPMGAWDRPIDYCWLINRARERKAVIVRHKKWLR